MATVKRTYGIGSPWLTEVDGSGFSDGGAAVAGGWSFQFAQTDWGSGAFAVAGLLPYESAASFLWDAPESLLPAPAGRSRPHLGTAHWGRLSTAVTWSTSIVDIIPATDSAEAIQNSEPSLAVNPLDPSQIIAAAFGAFSTGGMLSTPYFLSLDGGATWADYTSINTVDKSLAWAADGSAFLTALLTLRLSTYTDIITYSGTPTSGGFGSPINTFKPQFKDSLDQPWIRTGPSGHVYVAYNNLNNATSAGQGLTASVNVSTNGGSSFTPVVIEHTPPTGGQDAPAVRLAVNGNTVYAAFTRWNTQIENDSNGKRFNAQIVVVRSDNGGADGFSALGGGAGTVVAAPTGLFANTTNTPLTLGQERTSSDMAIAVDPNNASHVIIAYSDAPGANGAGQLQLILAESFDGGGTWNTAFTTDAATRSAQPALAITADGTIGFLYNNYDPATNMLSQHLVQTGNDFAGFTDTVLAMESNVTPVATFSPYVGDFFDLEAIGNTFYGIFGASNADDGTNAQFLAGTTFLRDFTGTPGTSNFQLTNGSGGNVAASIDPFFFTSTENPCFLRGTLILTEAGEVPVERLAAGDRVVTRDGTAKPIRWIGRRAYERRFVAGNCKVLPIAVAAGALADGIPARDLFVSPEHALFVDGVLVPAGHLVNGATIVQRDDIEAIEYFHIELDEHDVLFADGAPAETYADCDNRLMFANGADYVRSHPDGRRPRWQFCAPRLDRASAELVPIRAALLQRAALLGHALDPDPDLHLVVDGVRVEPDTVAEGVYRFRLAAGGTTVLLGSRSIVPAELGAAADDVRRLGVAVIRFILSDAHLSLQAGHDHPALRDGFHADEASHRWTDGLARLPAEWLRPFAGPLCLEVAVADGGLHYRVPPRRPAAA